MTAVDVDALRRMVEHGYLTVRQHPHMPLLIWNYTQRCQFERYWIPETVMCRGLITTPTGEIVARPFEKFFNLEEHIGLYGSVPAEPFEVLEKLDGSLGILYWDDRQSAIATRGSFESEQAIYGTRLLRERYPGFLLDRDYTYLFEIIYPQNRIVVDYGDREELVLIAVIHTQTGREISLHTLPWDGFSVARRYDGITDVSQVKALGGANEEGFVVRFVPSGVRVKIKLDEYVRLHRLLTGGNARVVWELLATGQTLDGLLDHVPDEFYAWVRATADALQTRYAEIEASCQECLATVQTLSTRKEQAAVITKAPYPAAVFKLLDGKSPAETIWKMLRPSAEKPFRIDNEG